MPLIRIYSSLAARENSCKSLQRDPVLPAGCATQKFCPDFVSFSRDRDKGLSKRQSSVKLKVDAQDVAAD
jgi:hypothetical protein